MQDNDFQDPDIVTTEMRVNQLESAFYDNLRKKSPKMADNIKNKVTQNVESEIKINIDTEQLLLSLYEVRDDLIDNFKGIDVNSILGESLTKQIEKLGNCISKMGGKVDTFNPLDHISGLKVPDLTKTASSVIENTKKYYIRGSVENASLNNDNTISVIFKGSERNINYVVDGTILALQGWIGNEAIDYIYTPGSGKMSVKIFENGRWIDKSASYELSWNLLEETNDNYEQKKEEGTIEKENKIANNKNKEEENDDNDNFLIIEKNKGNIN